MSTCTVDAGICGLSTTIRAVSEDGQACTLVIESECEAIQAMGEELRELDGYSVAFSPFDRNPVYQAATAHYKHAACPVPSAIIKAVEVACTLALPKDVTMKVER